MILLQYFIDQLLYQVQSQHALTGWQSNTCSKSHKFKVNTFWRDDKVTLVQSNISSRSTRFDGFNYDCGLKIRFQLYVELISRVTTA